MRVTIIADDGVVGVDGEFRSIGLGALDPNIHAVQWDGAAGEIEWNNPRRNEAISDFAPFQSFVDAWIAATPPPPPAPPPPVPDADQAELQIRGNKALLALGRIMTGNDALTEDALVALARAKLP